MGAGGGEAWAQGERAEFDSEKHIEFYTFKSRSYFFFFSVERVFCVLLHKIDPKVSEREVS